MEENIKAFGEFLDEEERSGNTRQKYLGDVRRFLAFADGKQMTKELVLEYKDFLRRKHRASSVNSGMAAVNKYLEFIGLPQMKAKYLKIQNDPFTDEDVTLEKKEYKRLCAATKGDTRVHLILNTICSTGIRVSELEFFTVENVREGRIVISLKGKVRRIIIPGKLRGRLLRYAAEMGITEGVIFRSRNGKPLNRSCIWRMMKALAGKAGVLPSKVFPHNLRKLFAREFYEIKKDIAKLADVLGHSSINTTRIYLKTDGSEHRRIIDGLCLLC